MTKRIGDDVPVILTITTEWHTTLTQAADYLMAMKRVNSWEVPADGPPESGEWVVSRDADSVTRAKLTRRMH